MSSTVRQFLVVDGEQTHVMDVSSVKTVDTLEFFDMIQIPRNNITTPTLPDNCRLFRRVRTDDYYVLEMRPSMWTVNEASAPEFVYQIAIPYVFLLVITRGNLVSTVNLYFGKEPYEIGKPVFHSGLPNQYSDGNVCAGNDFSPIVNGSGSLVSRLNKIIPYIRMSMFNDDLYPENSKIPTDIRMLAQNAEYVAWAADRPTAFREYLAIHADDVGPRRSRRLLTAWHQWTQMNVERRGQEATLRAVCELPWRSAQINLHA